MGKRSSSPSAARLVPYTSPLAKKPPHSRWLTLLAVLALCLAGAAAYHNSLDGVMVFDDVPTILQNRTIRNLQDIRTVLRGTNESTMLGRPVGNLSLAVNYAIHGTDVRGYHIFNIAVHVLAALTLFGVVRLTLRLPSVTRHFPGHVATALAFASALLWMVHPLQTESITYIVQRVEAMVGLFYLLTLYCLIRAGTGAQRRLWSVLAVIACLLGMATKEVMATAPLMLLLYDRLFLTGSLRATLALRWKLYLALAATWVLLGVLVATSGGRHGTAGFSLHITPESYALTQAYYVMRYLWLFLWPGPLVFDYGEYVAEGFWQIVPFVAMVLLLFAAVIVGLYRKPCLVFCAVWFFVVLAPTSSIIPVATQTGAEHRVYLSLAGMIVLPVLATYFFWRKILGWWPLDRPWQRWILPWAALIVLAAVWSIRTVQRNAEYHSALRIWQVTTERWPRGARAWDNLGYVLNSAGRPEEALKYQQTAVQLNPAIADYRQHLADCLAALGRTDEAIATYAWVIEHSPKYPHSYIYLGVLLDKQGREAEAIEVFRKGLAAIPNSVPAHHELGRLLVRRGRFAEAKDHVEAAAAAPEATVEDHYNLGLVYAGLGRRMEAIAAFERVFHLKADHYQALNNIAWLLATQPRSSDDVTRAVQVAEQGVEMTARKSPGLLDTLAVAYAAAGRFEEAIKTAEQAIELAQAARQESLAAEVQSRLELYRSGRPYREERPPETKPVR